MMMPAAKSGNFNNGVHYGQSFSPRQYTETSSMSTTPIPPQGQEMIEEGSAYRMSTTPHEVGFVQLHR